MSIISRDFYNRIFSEKQPVFAIRSSTPQSVAAWRSLGSRRYNAVAPGAVLRQCGQNCHTSSKICKTRREQPAASGSKDMLSIKHDVHSAASTYENAAQCLAAVRAASKCRSFAAAQAPSLAQSVRTNRAAAGRHPASWRRRCRTRRVRSASAHVGQRRRRSVRCCLAASTTSCVPRHRCRETSTDRR